MKWSVNQLNKGEFSKKEFGRKIKKIREEKRLTLIELEKLSGYSNSYISQVENGHKRPTYNFIKSLAKGLDYPFIELLKMVGLVPREEDKSTNPLSSFSTDELIQELKQRGKVEMKYVIK